MRTDHRPLITDHWPQTTDHWPQTTDPQRLFHTVAQTPTKSFYPPDPLGLFAVCRLLHLGSAKTRPDTPLPSYTPLHRPPTTVFGRSKSSQVTPFPLAFSLTSKSKPLEFLAATKPVLLLLLRKNPNGSFANTWERRFRRCCYSRHRDQKKQQLEIRESVHWCIYSNFIFLTVDSAERHRPFVKGMKRNVIYDLWRTQNPSLPLTDLWPLTSTQSRPWWLESAAGYLNMKK